MAREVNATERSLDARAAARVYYDGGCPVCRREVGWYAGMRGGEVIDWLDISGPTPAPDGLPPGKTVESLMRRFTITRHDGQTVSGGPGFIALWRGLGPLRRFAMLIDHPPGHWIGERIYRLFLRIRRLWRPVS